MRRLDQHIARIGKRKQMTRAKARGEIRRHVNIRTGNEPQCDSLLVENALQLLHGLPDCGAGIMIEPGQNMRRARHNRDALCN
jgi:hypothetical protein